MHDLDRILTENEDAFEDALGYEDERYEDDYEMHEFDDEEEEGADDSNLLSEESELDLASELLEAENDDQLDRVFGGISDELERRGRRARRRSRRKRRRSRRRRVARRAFRRLKPVLKGVVKRVLPIAGAAAGGALGGPLGAKVGGSVAPAAGQLLGLELEGLSFEDQELETARGIVRFAAEAMANADDLSEDEASPDEIVRSAVTEAAKKHAPGLIREQPGGPSRLQRGRWVRRGNKIVLIGV